MSLYAYIDLYEQGEKRKNIGFVRSEIREGNWKLRVCIKNLPRTDTLMCEMKTLNKEEYIDRFPIEEGTGSFVKEYSKAELQDRRIRSTEVQGLLFQLSSHKYGKCMWKNSGMREVNGDQSERNEKNGAVCEFHGDVEYGDVKYKGVENKGARYKDVEYENMKHESIRHEDAGYKRTEQIDVDREAVRYKNVEYENMKHESIRHEDVGYKRAEQIDVDREAVRYKDAEYENMKQKSISHEDVGYKCAEQIGVDREGVKYKDVENKDVRYKDSLRTAEKETTWTDEGISENTNKSIDENTNENTDESYALPDYECNHIETDKWKQLGRMYTTVHPFHEKEKGEYISIKPKDFVILCERYQSLVNNSFLLHGYFNYRHILLGKMMEDHKSKYYVGVPGTFHEREKKVAVMFGFEKFLGVKSEENGAFGYYMKEVKI